MAALSPIRGFAPGGGQPLVAVTRAAWRCGFALDAHAEVSTRNGRLFAKVSDGDGVLGCGWRAAMRC